MFEITTGCCELLLFVVIIKFRRMKMERLKQLRQSKNLSQQKLAELFNLSQQAIWKYEKGLAEPEISTLKKFADYFGVSVDYLLENSIVPEKSDLLIEKQLTPKETALVQYFRSCSVKRQDLILELLQEISENRSDN